MNAYKDDIWVDLARPWWSVLSRKEPVRTAVARAMAEHFAPAVFQALAANKRAGRTPGSQSDLARVFAITRGHVSRMIDGKQVFQTYDLIVLAHALHVSIDTLLPELPVLLPRATRQLAGPAATDIELLVYATYRLLIPAAIHRELDEDAVEAARQAGKIQSAKIAESIINRVAQAVGKKLREPQNTGSAR